MRVAVMGAGGVGGFLGGLMARHGHEVALIARGEHLRALQRNGLVVRSAQRGDFEVPVQATDDPSEVGPVDLVLFTVKTYDTESAGRAILPMLGPESVVLTLQNGIDSGEVLSKIIPTRQLLGGAARMESTISEPGVIHQISPGTRVDFGEYGGPPTARTERLLEVFRESTWSVHLVPDLRRALWEKFVTLSALAGVQTLAAVTMGEMTGRPDLRETYLATVREGVAVARADGYDLGTEYVDQAATVAQVTTPSMKMSMQRDHERGKRIEVDALSGTTVRLGRQYGVPTPVSLAIYACLKVYDDRVGQASGG